MEEKTEQAESAYTGRSFRADKREAVAKRVLDGQGLNAACRAEHISPATARAYQLSHPDWLEQASLRLRGLTGQVLDRYEQALQEGRVRAESLPIAYGIFHDKLQDLAIHAPASPNKTDSASIGSALAALAQLCQAKADPERTVTVTVKSEPALPVIDCQAEQTGGGEA